MFIGLLAPVASGATAWDSPFVGVVAVPLAAGEFERLYRALAGKLFDDPSFLRALSND
ncbi:hypothetical protein [Noviherbaspirillum sp. ST9]|uniref:hypothetical protein n=1 Tax=Noviherbaspirillum sp. ST9 TaxID=3401606 RepID=UPI003B587453